MQVHGTRRELAEAGGELHDSSFECTKRNVAFSWSKKEEGLHRRGETEEGGTMEGEGV